MNWTFNEERKADWADIAATIHDVVTMDEVLHIYAPQVHTRNHRCPCPFHNGKDYNFSYTRSGYKCFVCGASGDVISFVKEIQGYPTRSDAMKRINADLRLGLPVDGNVSAELSADLAKRRAERERREKAEAEWWGRYHALLDEWIRLDVVKRTADPTSDEYAEAVKRIDRVGYLLDCHEAGDKSLPNF